MLINTSTRSSQVRDYLVDYIKKNGLAAGEKLPSEPELAAKIGVSRNTIREAYIVLEAEGVVERRHGVGTFVARPQRVKEPILDELTSFKQSIEAAGCAFSFKIISKESVTPEERILRAFQIGAEERVFQIKTVLYADDVPTLFVADHFSILIDESKLDWDNFDGDILKFVSESTGILERLTHSRIFAKLADEEIAQYLGLEVGFPVVNIHSSFSAMDGQQRSYSIIYVNPAKFEYEVTRIYRNQ